MAVVLLTVPVLERAWAQNERVGRQNSRLINKQSGSFFYCYIDR
jgi:hypothetical protein